MKKIWYHVTVPAVAHIKAHGFGFATNEAGLIIDAHKSPDFDYTWMLGFYEHSTSLAEWAKDWNATITKLAVQPI